MIALQLDLVGIVNLIASIFLWFLIIAIFWLIACLHMHTEMHAYAYDVDSPTAEEYVPSNL